METRRARELRATRRAAQRGMTLIEIMVVVIIMAMIATGVAVAVIPRLEAARIDATKTDIAAIRSAVQMYMATKANKCPTLEDLKTDKFLDQTKRTTDAWEQEFVIQCQEGDDPIVKSNGPDKQEGTEDDIQ